MNYLFGLVCVICAVISWTDVCRPTWSDDSNMSIDTTTNTTTNHLNTRHILADFIVLLQLQELIVSIHDTYLLISLYYYYYYN